VVPEFSRDNINQNGDSFIGNTGALLRFNPIKRDSEQTSSTVQGDMGDEVVKGGVTFPRDA
jgi:hypothetical protein